MSKLNKHLTINKLISPKNKVGQHMLERVAGRRAGPGPRGPGVRGGKGGLEYNGKGMRVRV